MNVNSQQNTITMKPLKKTNIKSKEEIDDVYKRLYLSLDDSPHYHTWVRGYTQCQEYMALSQPKEVDLGELREEFDSDFTDNSGYIHYRTPANDLFNWILPHLQKPVDSDAVSFVGESTITSYYPITLSSKAYDKLLAIQTKPDTKYWFKDKEVSIEELINILETA